MELRIKKRNIQTSDNFPQSAFTIKASGKAFKILSDGLYSDKIRAIIRELSCNAYDAHVAADTVENKFDVHLPTRFQPEFYVRDYGTGLCKNDIQHVYTTYFESTKTDSNDAVGCLGLGSKSPFSYVDMFTVTSFFNGEMYVYTALLNEAGLPSIMLVHEGETDEPNGLKVQFPVKNEDVDQFSYKAKEVFKYFNNMPNFVGNNINIPKREYSVLNDRWGLSKNRSGQAYAVMGNIAYPVSLDQVNFSQNVKTIINSFPVDLFFELGELDIQASREALSYDEETIKAITSRIDKIIKDEKDRVEKDLNKCKNYWDAVLWMRKEKQDNRIVKLLFENIKVSYKGRVISDHITFNRKDYEDLKKTADEEFSFVSMTRKSRYDRKLQTSVTVIGKPDKITRIYVNNDVLVMICDTKSKYLLRAKKVMNDNPDIKTLYLLKSENDDMIKKFIQEVAKKGITRLSTIEPPKVIRKKKNNSAVGHFAQMKWLGSSYYYEASEFWGTIEDADEFDLDEGGYYVPINRWKVLRELSDDRGVKEEHPRDVLATINKLYSSLYDQEPTVYAIKKAKLELVEGKDEWTNWLDHAQEEIRKFILTPDIYSALQAITSKKNINYGSIGRMFLCARSLKQYKNVDDPDLIVDSQFYDQCDCEILKELAQRYDQMHAPLKNMDIDIQALWSFVSSGLSTLTQKEIDGLHNYSDRHDTLMSEFEEKYPLLEECSKSFGSPTGISNILGYINAMNK